MQVGIQRGNKDDRSNSHESINCRVNLTTLHSWRGCQEVVVIYGIVRQLFLWSNEDWPFNSTHSFLISKGVFLGEMTQWLFTLVPKDEGLYSEQELLSISLSKYFTIKMRWVLHKSNLICEQVESRKGSNCYHFPCWFTIPNKILSMSASF